MIVCTTMRVERLAYSKGRDYWVRIESVIEAKGQ